MISFDTHHSVSTYYKRTESYTSYLDTAQFFGTNTSTYVVYNTRSASASTEYSEKWDSTSYTFMSKKAGFGELAAGNLQIGAGFDVNYFYNGITLGSGYASTSVFETWAITSTASSQAAGRTSYQENSAGHDGALGGGASTDGFTFTGSSATGRTQTTYQKNHDGKTTLSGTTAIPITLTATETYALTTLFGYAGGSQVSGSASATRLSSSAPFQPSTYTSTFAGTPTVYLYGGKFYAPYIKNARQNPPPLRAVAPLLAVTESSVQASAYAMFPVIDSVFSGIEKFYKSSTSSKTEQDIAGSNTAASAWTALEGGVTRSHVLFTVTDFSSSAANLALEAKRKDLSFSYIEPEIIGYDENDEPIFGQTPNVGFYFTNLSASQSFFYLTQIEPSELSTMSNSWFVPVLNGHFPDKAFPGQMPRIFTNVETAQINGSSASVRWAHISSSWKIVITKANSSTSLTTTGQISFLSTISTKTAEATGLVGNTTAILGPAFPLGFSGMNEVSFTLREAGDTESTQSSAVFFGHSGRHGASSYADASFSSNSFSTVHTLGSGSGWQRVTYPDSSLTAYKNKKGVSFSTSTKTVQFSTLSLPPTTTHRKWNEAGRTDSVALTE